MLQIVLILVNLLQIAVILVNLLQIIVIVVNLLQIVVILVGTNNHGDTPDHIAEGLKAICSLIREKLPKAFLILLVSTVSPFLLGYLTAGHFLEKNLSDS